MVLNILVMPPSVRLPSVLIILVVPGDVTEIEAAVPKVRLYRRKSKIPLVSVNTPLIVW